MTKIVEELFRYSEDVIDKKIPAGQEHIWACQRFIKDLERVQSDDDFPYVWNEEKTQDIVDWFSFLKHTKGILAGKPIKLTTWQKFSICQVFGWVHKDTGNRRFKKVYKQVGRKNAKSQELSGVGLYMLCADGEESPEVYCTATKRDQAKIVLNESQNMAKRSPLNNPNILKINRDSIEHPNSLGVMRALSKEDQKKGDGYSPHLAIIDEYHSHETSEMYDIMDSALGNRKQALIYVITTAGFDLNKPCYSVEYNYARKILDPNTDISNDQYLAIICQIDAEDDIKDENNWIKANPILASYDEGMDYLRMQLQVALEAPEKMRNFMTKNMNRWIQQKEDGYMDMSKWGDCGTNLMPEVEGLDCFVGIDLSAKHDLTSVSFDIPLGDGRYAVYSHSFMPEDSYWQKIKTDKVPYDLWAREGWLTLTDGAVVDYRYIEDYIIQKAEELGVNIKEICYDPYNATQFAQQIQDKGYVVVEIRQGVQTLSEPTKNFRDCVISKKIVHNNNPVLNWALSNAVQKADHNENIKLDKNKSVERIDPISALLNAHVRAMVVEDTTSIYEDRGIRVL